MEMDPTIWEQLPPELLQLVFSRLPVPEIYKLQALSRTWKQNVDSVNSEFSNLLEETTYSKMFGAISFHGGGRFQVIVVDVKGRQQQFQPGFFAFKVDPLNNSVITMGASDGGLVCFVSRGTTLPKFIVVMNPLTRKKVELPRLCGMDGHVASNAMPLMVQLTMDRQTWQYKVIVVGFMVIDGAPGKHLFAQIYDSVIRGWTVVGSVRQNWDRFFGYTYSSSIDVERRLNNHLAPIGPCMYDSAAGGLHYFRKNKDGLGGPYAPYLAAQGLPQGDQPYAYKDNIARAVCKNHLFVLRREVASSSDTSHYFISEYVLERNATAWVEVGTIHNLPFFELSLPMYRSVSFSLNACKGFLLLYLNSKIGYIYDLSGRCWFELPRIRARPLSSYRDLIPVDLLCELRLNVSP